MAICGKVAAHAIEPSDVLVYTLGPVSLRPQVGSFAQYNDNVFYRKANTDSDVILGVVPGMRAVFGEDLPDQNHVTLAYKLEEDFYVSHTELNAAQHRFALDGFYGTGRTKIQGTDRVEFLSSTLAGGFSSVNGQKVDRTVWTDVYRVDYQFGERTATYAHVDHGSTDYKQGINLFDLDSIEGSVGFEWIFSERTRLFGEGYYGKVFVGRNGLTADPPGTAFTGGFVGARGDFTERLKGLVKVGYEMYRFDKRPAVVGGRESGSAPAVGSTLSYQLTERTSLSLDYQRREQISPEIARSAYTSDEVTLGAAARLGAADRLRADVNGRFGMYTYEPSPAFSKRNDTTWGITAGLTWLFETWLSARLEYSFSEGRSDLPTIIEYDQNRITVSVAVGY